MAIWDFRPRADLWTSAAIGVGLLLAPAVIPMIAEGARPVVKAVLKAGFILYEKGGELFAEAFETVEDLAVEAKSKVHAELEPVEVKAIPAKGKRGPAKGKGA